MEQNFTDTYDEIREDKPKNVQSKYRSSALKMAFGGNKEKDFEEWFIKRLKRFCSSNKPLESVDNLNLAGEILSHVYIFVLYENAANTAKVKFALVKRLIEQYSDGLHREFLLKLFRFPVYRSINEVQEELVKLKISNQKELNIKDMKAFVAELENRIKTKRLMSVDNEKLSMERHMIYHKLLYLLYVTGRRYIEIMKVVEIVEKEDGYYFKGLAKKRGRECEVKALILDDDVPKIKRYMAEVRAFFNSVELTEKEINQKFAGLFNKWLKRYGIRHTPREMRSVYAYLAHDKFGYGMDSYYFFTQVLGHDVEVLSTPTAHYLGYRVKK